MSQLPKQRMISNKPPISTVGTEHFGPFLTRTSHDKTKRYDIFSHVLQLEHIEIAYSLDTLSLIQALRRFATRRGQVTQIISNIGTDLVGSKRELREVVQS